MQILRIRLFAPMALLTAAAGLGTQNVRAVPYDTYIAATQPVGWWGMNETGAVTTTVDMSGAYGAANNQAGGNLPLTYQGAATNTIADQPGHVVSSSANRAAYFDGTSSSGLYGHGASAYDLAVAGAIYRYEPNGFSAEFWINPQVIGGGLDCQRVIATREFGFGFEDPAAGSHRLQFTTFGKQDYFSTAGLAIDGNWHQIGFSFDGNVTTTFYIDGVAAGTSVGTTAGIRTALSPGANTINLGHRNTDLQHFKGLMDEAVLWGTPRTAGDFSASFLAATTVIPDAYALWATDHGLTAANHGKTDDPDGDGVANVLEFYLNGDPLAADSHHLKATVDGNNLVLTYQRRDDAEDLNIVPQASTTLSNWETLVDGVNGVAIVSVENGAAPDDITITIPCGTQSRIFVRLGYSSSS